MPSSLTAKRLLLLKIEKKIKRFTSRKRVLRVKINTLPKGPRFCLYRIKEFSYKQI